MLLDNSKQNLYSAVDAVYRNGSMPIMFEITLTLKIKGKTCLGWYRDHFLLWLLHNSYATGPPYINIFDYTIEVNISDILVSGSKTWSGHHKEL